MKVNVFLLSLLKFLFLISTVQAEETIAGSVSRVDNKLVVAILDSGISLNDENFTKYDIESIDLTGEGPEDLNGHGTSIASLALGFPNWMDPKKVKVLNIKILDRNIKTDEVTLLKGLFIASENGAEIINLSAGVWIDESEALLPVRKLLQWQRRYPDILLVAAAGNYGMNLDVVNDGKIFFPQQASLIAERIKPEYLHKDILQDAIYIAKRGQFQKANQLLVRLVMELPSKEVEEKALMLRRGILFTEFSFEYGKVGENEKSEAFKQKAKQALRGIASFEKLFDGAEKRY